MRRFFSVLAAVCLLGTLPALAVVEHKRGAADPRITAPRPPIEQSVALKADDRSRAGEARRDFLGKHGGEWVIEVDPRTGLVSLAQGSGVPIVPGRGNTLKAATLDGLVEAGQDVTAAAIEPLVRQFVDANAAFFTPAVGQLVYDKRSSLARDGARLISVYYDWMLDGVPIEGAGVFVRINSGNVVQFGSRFVGAIELETRPAIKPERARELLLEYTGDDETARLEGEPELLIQVEGGPADRLEYRLVWKFRYTVLGRIETWEGRVDAATGQVVSFRDVNHYARARGGVYARGPLDPEGEVSVPIPFLSVVASGLTVTNAGGFFPYNGGVARSRLDGRFFAIDCQNCSDPEQPDAITVFGAGRLDFGEGGVDHVGNGTSTPSDRTTLYHLTQIRRLAHKWLPSLPWLAELSFTANTNIADTCNAFFNGTSVNFFRSGGGCLNTGENADVIRHEWGHGLDNNTLGGDGGTGEGTADVTSMQMSHSPLVGPGFRATGSPVRDLDSSTTGIGLLTLTRIRDGDCTNTNGDLSVHCAGQVYGQSAWDLAVALTAKHGHHTGWRVSEKLFFTSLPDAGTYEPLSGFSIYNAYLLADDDDGDLTNGTPNAKEIYTAFNTHEIAREARPNSTPCTRPTQPEVTVTPACDTVEVSWTPVAGATQYQVLRAELFEDSAFLPVGVVAAGETSFTDFEVGPTTDYWYTVLAINEEGCESTTENPAYMRLNTHPILELTAVFPDDTPAGNRSGFPDPGEQTDLLLELTNFAELDAAAISGTLISTTAGVTVIEGAASWPDIPGGGSAVNQTPLRIEAHHGLACGGAMRFQLVPDEDSGCASDISFFDVRLGEDVGGGFICDDTPACFVAPDFDGITGGFPGFSCGETTLFWAPATTNCTNATISYNVYRSTEPDFVPSAENLVATGLETTEFADSLLESGRAYHYIVRADDSRSGEDGNMAVQTVVAREGNDIEAPLFDGLASADSGDRCGETVLRWAAGVESCSLPVTYEIHRSTEPAFTPRPETIVGLSTSTSFTDAALDPAMDYTYVVRARDAVGNFDPDVTRLTVRSGAVDLILAATSFEPNEAGWQVIQPNDANPDGIWDWGDPVGTAFQPENDATPDGVNCWITGLFGGASNGDIDGGTTTLLTDRYDMAGAVNPTVRYSRWFTNDQGANPGEPLDVLQVDVSNDDGQTWVPLEQVGAGTPLAWIPVELSLTGVIEPTSEMRFRFSAADLLEGSLVEAGIDDFELSDRDRGCGGCVTPVGPVERIVLDKVGSDVVIDWTEANARGERFVVYRLNGATFDEALAVGSTRDPSFVHEGVLGSPEILFYRVSAVDACGNESD